MNLAGRISQVVIPEEYSWKNFLDLLTRSLKQIQHSKQIAQITNELPDLLLIFALCMKSGASVGQTIEYIAQRSVGVVSKDFREIVLDLELGGNLVSQLQLFSESYPQPRIEEFTQTLISSLELGATISDSLIEQSKSANDEIARSLAKQAASNETKMLLPTIFLILPVTVLFAVFPSLAMLSPAI